MVETINPFYILYLYLFHLTVYPRFFGTSVLDRIITDLILNTED
jgi:hypothetical protein